MLLTKNEVYEMARQQFGDETEVLEVGVDRALIDRKSTRLNSSHQI